MTALVAFVRLGRPLFLGGGFILFAIGAAVAAAQAVLDGIGDFADRTLLEDQALVADQQERRRVCVREIGVDRRIAQQLAAVEATVGIDRTSACASV